MSKNKKILNAAETEFLNIKFKSKAEARAYKLLVESFDNICYESDRFILVEGFKPSVAFYSGKKSKKTAGSGLHTDMSSIRQITYTPDFTVRTKDVTAYIEIKGFENDVFPLKKKLFRKYLESLEGNYIFLEVFTLKQLKQAIAIIQNFNNQKSNET